MDQTSKLPDELLVQILMNIPHRPRSSNVALVCRRFCRCVEQHLWSSIYLHHDDLQSSLRTLSLALRMKPKLGRLVKHFDCITESMAADLSENVIMEDMVTRCPNMTKLSINTCNLNAGILSLSALHTLNLHASRSEKFKKSPRFAVLDVLSQVFQIPSLQRLCVDLTGHWDPENHYLLLPEDYFLDSNGKISGLQIQDLSWLGCGHAVNALIPVIPRLRNLKRLACSEQNTATDGNSLRFARSLQSHEESLEEFIVHDDTAFEAAGLSILMQGDDQGIKVDLRNFTALKRLSIDLGPYIGAYMDQRQPDYFCRALPSQLETLEIRSAISTEKSHYHESVSRLHDISRVLIEYRQALILNLKKIIFSIDLRCKPEEANITKALRQLAQRHGDTGVEVVWRYKQPWMERCASTELGL